MCEWDFWDTFGCRICSRAKWRHLCLWCWGASDTIATSMWHASHTQCKVLPSERQTRLGDGGKGEISRPATCPTLWYEPATFTQNALHIHIASYRDTVSGHIDSSLSPKNVPWMSAVHTLVDLCALSLKTVFLSTPSPPWCLNLTRSYCVLLPEH